MSEHRIQHSIPGILVLILAITVCWISYTQEPAEAFLFPRLITTLMLILASWNCFRAVSGMAKVGNGIPLHTLGTILPGLLVTVFQVFFFAKFMGFYASSAISFLVLFSIYDPYPHTSIRVWGKRAVITLGFMLVIYGLFSLLLKVQTPRGIFF